MLYAKSDFERAKNRDRNENTFIITLKSILMTDFTTVFYDDTANEIHTYIKIE